MHLQYLSTIKHKNMPFLVMKSLEKLDIEIPRSKNINTIKSLIRNLPQLKLLVLRKIPDAQKSQETIRPQFLERSAIEELEREFPKLKIIHG